MLSTCQEWAELEVQFQVSSKQNWTKEKHHITRQHFWSLNAYHLEAMTVHTDCQLDRNQNLWVSLSLREFGLTEVGRSMLNLGSTILWPTVLDCI